MKDDDSEIWTGVQCCYIKNLITGQVADVFELLMSHRDRSTWLCLGSRYVF